MTEESQLGPSIDGTVVLDIGDDIGALVLTTGADLHLAEIEISRVDGEYALPDGAGPAASSGGDDPHVHVHDDGAPHTHDGAPRTHVAVRQRLGAAGVRYAAIYPALRSGDYTVWGLDGEPAAAVTVVGGEVSTLDWS